jgi:hypothetical protein
VIQHGFSEDDLAKIRAAPRHYPELPCPVGSVLIEDPEGIVRAVPVPAEIQAGLPRMFPNARDASEE